MKYKKYKDKFGLIIDFETSGSNWNMSSDYAFQGISLGAVVFNTTTLEPVDEFYVEIMFDPDNGLKYNTSDRIEKLKENNYFDKNGNVDKTYGWSPEAEAIHGLSIEHLCEHGLSQEDAATEFLNFISNYWILGDKWSKILLLAHNRQFDIGFMRQLMESVGMHNFSDTYRITELDASALSWFAFGLHKSDDVFDFLDLPERTMHNALEDCLMTLKACKNIRNIMESAIGMSVSDI